MQRRWGEVEAARVSLSQAESLAPDLPEIAMEWGNLLASSDPAAALRAYSQAIVRDPQALEARLARAQLYQQQGQALLAVADYRAALAQDSTLLAAHEGIEVILGQFGARIAAANQEIRPYIARANLYQQLGRLEEALSDWSEAIRLDPRNALLMAGRAQVLAEQQQYAAAYDEYTRAMDAMPQQAGFYFERAQVLVAQVRMLPALADLDRAIALAPEKGGYYLLRGMLYRQLEEVAPALADLDQAVNLTPDRGDVWQERARLYVMMQRLPEALRDYQRAVSLMPDADLHRDCAAVADVLGQSALALDHLNQALRLDPDQLDTLLERAELLIAQGAWERAIQDLDRVLIQEPNLVRPWLLRARAGVHLKRWESAASDASRALVRDAMQGEAYYLRGVSYFEMGAYAQSAQDLRHYLQRQETSGNHEQVLRLIRLADSHQQPRRKPWWRR
jgi:tetratricopeptide (TPR) repeat protein